MDEQQWRKENWNKSVASSSDTSENLARWEEKKQRRGKRLDILQWWVTGFLIGLAIGIAITHQYL